jgi:polysaccharide biosynthesis protein PslH
VEGSATPRWLWVTPAITEHRSTGALVYSLSLADAVAEHGIDVTCVGLGSSAPVASPTDLTCLLVDGSPRPGWRSLVSRYPNQTSATSVPAFRKRVDELLRVRWDAVVVDSFQTGWVVSQLGADRSQNVVYISQNHETSMRTQIARSAPWRTLRRPVLELDAWKTRRLEADLLRRADVVSSISVEDLERFRHQAPNADHVLVPPGWSGPTEPRQTVAMADRPRRVGILGSFEWHPKQEGLRRFLAVADPVFAAADIDLVIAGSAPEDFRRGLGDLRATTFLGWVESPAEVLASCRVGVIAEPLGGGFKLKALDYVFNAVAVATLSHSAAGLPFAAGSSMIVTDDEASLVDAIVQAIDDPSLLQRTALEALEIATDRFSWPAAARSLIDAVGERSATTS